KKKPRKCSRDRLEAMTVVIKTSPTEETWKTAGMKDQSTTTNDPGLLLQELVYAGLDAVRAAIPVDLCAYLHESLDEGPQLFLVTPDLGTIDPTEAFNLFSALRDTLKGDHTGEETLRLGEY